MWYQDFMPRGLAYNPEATGSIKKLNKEIDEESRKEKPDFNKIYQMKMSRILEAGKLTTGGNYYGGSHRAMYPY